ncbi:unnamed protein product [Leuciscus chuanchicus]
MTLSGRFGEKSGRFLRDDHVEVGLTSPRCAEGVRELECAGPDAFGTSSELARLVSASPLVRDPCLRLTWEQKDVQRSAV